MAFIEKVTTLRRMALINYDNGAIEYEGVDIEHVCVLKPVGSDKPKDIVSVKASQVEEFAAKRKLLVRYQDPEGEDFWEPRA